MSFDGGTRYPTAIVSGRPDRAARRNPRLDALLPMLESFEPAAREARRQRAQADTAAQGTSTPPLLQPTRSSIQGDRLETAKTTQPNSPQGTASPPYQTVQILDGKATLQPTGELGTAVPPQRRGDQNLPRPPGGTERRGADGEEGRPGYADTAGNPEDRRPLCPMPRYRPLDKLSWPFFKAAFKWAIRANRLTDEEAKKLLPLSIEGRSRVIAITLGQGHREDSFDQLLNRYSGAIGLSDVEARREYKTIRQADDETDMEWYCRVCLFGQKAWGHSALNASLVTKFVEGLNCLTLRESLEIEHFSRAAQALRAVRQKREQLQLYRRSCEDNYQCFCQPLREEKDRIAAQGLRRPARQMPPNRCCPVAPVAEVEAGTKTGLKELNVHKEHVTRRREHRRQAKEEEEEEEERRREEDPRPRSNPPRPTPRPRHPADRGQQGEKPASLSADAFAGLTDFSLLALSQLPYGPPPRPNRKDLEATEEPPPLPIRKSGGLDEEMQSLQGEEQDSTDEETSKAYDEALNYYRLTRVDYRDN